MVKRLRSTRGYTLIEILMVVAILGIIAVMAPRIIIQLVRFFSLHTAKIEIQRDARNALDLINRQLRQASAVSVVINQATNQPPYSRVSFQNPQGQTLLFYQQGKKLYHVASSTNAICNNLRFIAFTYPRSDDPTIVSVALTTEKSIYEGRTKALELSIEKVRIMNP